MKFETSHHLLCTLVLAPATFLLAEAADWTLASVQCAPEDAPHAMYRSVSLTQIHCVQMKTKIQTGALVAQFNAATQLCSVFHYQSVCQLLVPGRTPDCEVFFRFPIEHSSISSKLTNVWIGDAESRLENLVCQADPDTNRLHPAAVQWTGAGAEFDGLAAHAVLTKPNISFSGGLTWLLRIKRQPQSQPLFEFVDCNSLGTSNRFLVHLWEFSLPRQLLVRMGRVTGSLIQKRHATNAFLPASPEDWVNIGVTTRANGDSYDIYLNDAFVARNSYSSINDPEDYPTPGTLCLYLGKRVDPDVFFKGTLKAFALGGELMTESEIREFFSLVV